MNFDTILFSRNTKGFLQYYDKSEPEKELFMGEHLFSLKAALSAWRRRRMPAALQLQDCILPYTIFASIG